MAPFYVWGSTASRLEPLLGGSLPFTTHMTIKQQITHGDIQKVCHLHNDTFHSIHLCHT